MNEFLQNLLYVVITTVLPILVGYGISYLKAKRDKELLNIDNTYIEETIIKATDIVLDTVDTVTQTYVDDLKKSGAFNEKEQKTALSKAINQAKELITLDTANLIVEQYNDLDTWIRNTIESYITKTKNYKYK